MKVYRDTEELLHLRSKGLSNAEIAEEVGRSPMSIASSFRGMHAGPSGNTPEIVRERCAALIGPMKARLRAEVEEIMAEGA